MRATRPAQANQFLYRAPPFIGLFNPEPAGGTAGSWLTDSGILHVRCDDPHILSWPWKALYRFHFYLEHRDCVSGPSVYASKVVVDA